MDRIGIIGGTGLISIDFGKDYIETLSEHHLGITRTDLVTVETKYGEVPLKCISMTYGGKAKELIFLQRHHNNDEANKPPHMINHKANITALINAGCDVIISVCSIGTLVKDLPPGKVALAGQYIDFSGIATSFNDICSIYISY